MKQSSKNAVDLLLRSLARREQGESLAGENGVFADRPGSPIVSDHLDADELNLYAEGVLPAPARSRYNEHLADCGRCRGILVGLAQAAGTGARYETANQQSDVGWWHRFAALFSVPVLRYALPALVLTSVIGIVFLALRDQSGGDLLARRQTAENAAPLIKPAESSSPETGLNSGATEPSLEKRAVPSANTESSEQKNSPVDTRGLLDETRDAIAGATPPAPPAAKSARDYPEVVGATTSQPAFAKEPAPAKSSVGEADMKALARKEESLEREAQKQQAEGFAVQTKDDSPTHGPARSRAPSVGGRLNSGSATENRVDRDKAKKVGVEETETRTVSGRRFRRQGNAWIDTAYEPSRSATNVARGSEQFRALMADEPGLRVFAEQLGGEVVVVWKNRAYRIR